VGEDHRPAPLPLLGGAVVLYVDDRCRFCREELARWYRAAGTDPPEGLVVVRHPAAPGHGPGIVPSAWASRALRDPEGDLAAALGVTAVPFLARSDAAGTVVEVALGLTPEHRILDLLQTLAHGRESDLHHE